MEKPSFKPYSMPSGGWGSARSVGNILRREGVLASAPLALTRHNKVDGYQCTSCAWIKPAKPLPLEFCENGVKAVAWDLTAHRCTPAFFDKHTVTELLGWDDYHLEQTGRLTQPLRYDPATDKYVPVSWGAAVEEIARELDAVDDKLKGTAFYSSGRLSNEASYLYRPLRPPLRQQQPARQLEHVPRDHLRGPPRQHRPSRRHRHPRRLRQIRLHHVLRPEPRQQLAPHAPPAPGSQPPRRPHHHLQPPARTRPRALPQPAIPHRNADRPPNAHQLAIPPGQDRRRPRRPHRHLQGRARLARRSRRRRPPRPARRSLHRRTHHRLRNLRRLAPHPELGRARTPLRPPPGRHGIHRQGLQRGPRHHRHLRHGRHPAPRRRRNRPDDRQPAAHARQHRPPRLRHLPRPRPFQRAGPAHHGHHRKARPLPARPPRRAVRLPAPQGNRLQHGRRLRGRAQGRTPRLLHARRQLRPRHPRPRPDGARLAPHPPHRQRHHQAQPQRAPAR